MDVELCILVIIVILSTLPWDVLGKLAAPRSILLCCFYLFPPSSFSILMKLPLAERNIPFSLATAGEEQTGGSVTRGVEFKCVVF